MPETEGQESPRKAQRLDQSNVDAVANALDKQGKHTLADSLRQPTPSQAEIRERQLKDHEAWAQNMDAKRAAETPVVPPSPSSQKAVRLDTKDVDAVLNALEQAKKLPVPQGEESGQFYYRKAMELLSQEKEQ